jgi:hypothetical protein
MLGHRYMCKQGQWKPNMKYNKLKFDHLYSGRQLRTENVATYFHTVSEGWEIRI